MSQHKGISISHDLPPEIHARLNKIIVQRQGGTEKAYMKTTSIPGFVSPQQLYRITPKGPEAIANEKLPDFSASAHPQNPPTLFIKATWHKETHLSGSDANILGDFGKLQVESKELSIPSTMATKENLLFYQAKLLKVGECLKFDSPYSLPITTVEIGEEYVNEYLMKENFGEGVYFETHNTPHYHQPLDNKARGFLILGKQEGDHYFFTAFQIPFGYAVYTPPHTIHDDAFLIGNYVVIYTVTDEFSTVLLKDKQDCLVKVKIAE